MFHRFHQLHEEAVVGNGHLLQLLQALLGGASVAGAQVLEHGDLVLLLLFRGADYLGGDDGGLLVV